MYFIYLTLRNFVQLCKKILNNIKQPVFLVLIPNEADSLDFVDSLADGRINKVFNPCSYLFEL